jgi:phosphatidylserine/phosphatidylglycerophosphate/cardiolipin synthase-like enzyme
VNETLRRALLRARLSEDDVAARLQVDPKTVRRWLEGRVPYQRHRWGLTCLLDADEADLWPEVRAAITARSRPPEIKAVYPNRQAMPRQAWLSLFSSAEREIGILARSALFLARRPDVLDVLADRAQDGVRVRICLRDPDWPVTAEGSAGQGASDAATAEIREALALFRRLRASAGVEIRLHRAVLYNSIYRADNQLLVSQHAYGIPGERAAVLHLRPANDGDLVATYLDAFERICTGALPLE